MLELVKLTKYQMFKKSRRMFVIKLSVWRWVQVIKCVTVTVMCPQLYTETICRIQTLNLYSIHQAFLAFCFFSCLLLSSPFSILFCSFFFWSPMQRLLFLAFFAFLLLCSYLPSPLCPSALSSLPLVPFFAFPVLTPGLEQTNKQRVACVSYL